MSALANLVFTEFLGCLTPVSLLAEGCWPSTKQDGSKTSIYYYGICMHSENNPEHQATSAIGPTSRGPQRAVWGSLQE